MENPLATTYRNDRKRQTAPMSMVTRCILIVPRKVPSNRETASGQVSDGFPMGPNFSMFAKGCLHLPCLHTIWKPALLLWLASGVVPGLVPRGRSGLATAHLCLKTDCVYPMAGVRSTGVDPTISSCSIARSWHPYLCPVAAAPDAWRRWFLEGLTVQPRGYARLLQWGRGDRTKVNETEIVPKRFGLHYGTKGEPTKLSFPCKFEKGDAAGLRLAHPLSKARRGESEKCSAPASKC